MLEAHEPTCEKLHQATPVPQNANPLRFLILTQLFTTECEETTNALRHTLLVHYQLANGLSFSH